MDAVNELTHQEDEISILDEAHDEAHDEDDYGIL
jgi:hypothetical protein